MERSLPKFSWLVVLILVCLLSACAQERVFTQPNSAMEPTVLEGEKFAVNGSAYRNSTPVRGDVVVLRHGDILVLKRVIAVSSDTVEGRDFQVILSGTQLQEAYVQHTGKNSDPPPSFSFLKNFGPTKVPIGQIFVMGDNRDFSNDSRDPSFGTISVSDVLGKALRIVKSSNSGREGTVIH